MSGDKPGPDATVVTDAIIEYCMERMAYRAKKYQLKREVSLIVYGPELDKKGEVIDPDIPARLISINSYETLRRKAREILHERSVIKTETARGESVGLYEAILIDPSASHRDKMKAQENLDKIHRVTTPDPMPDVNLGFVPVDKLNLTLEEKTRLLDAMTKNASDSDSDTT